MADSHPSLPPLVRGLLDPAAYPHQVERLELVETHISWVILTGRYAYKIKKPIDLGFLDFSTLARRRRACAEELRLNRRLAPETYQSVVEIGGSPSAPKVGGPRPALEVAVRMRQFDRTQELDQLLRTGRLTPEVLDDLARRVAGFHAGLAAVPESRPWGTPAAVLEPVRANFSQFGGQLGEPSDKGRVERLRAWSLDAWRRLRGELEARRRAGFVRECHGDLHLGNMVLGDDGVIIFDCLEFNPALRWIDVISELAFLVMDLDDHQRPDLAARVLNRYLEESGDYAGLRLLCFYQVYRSLVRAKVACIRMRQASFTESPTQLRAYRSYAALAEAYTEPPRPLLVITRGPTGSGKSSLTQPLLERLGAVRLRSDVERKRLFGLRPLASSRSSTGRGLYTKAASERTYARLEELAADLLVAGFPVLVDATFLERRRRIAFQRLARELAVPFVILELRTSTPTLRRRVQGRLPGSDASEADLAVLERQLAVDQALAPEERACAIAVDTEVELDSNGLVVQLERLRAGGDLPSGTG